MQPSFTPSPENPILFFDGVCGLCDGFVNFVMRRDKLARFRFATLQGETFSALAAKLGLQGPPAFVDTSANALAGNKSVFDDFAVDPSRMGESVVGDPRRASGAWMSSMLLYDGIEMQRKSEGGLRVLQGLGGIWVLTGIFRLVPRFIRDRGYDFVARNRYRWFGKKETCRLPTLAERARFLP